MKWRNIGNAKYEATEKRLCVCVCLNCDENGSERNLWQWTGSIAANLVHYFHSSHQLIFSSTLSQKRAKQLLLCTFSVYTSLLCSFCLFVVLSVFSVLSFFRWKVTFFFLFGTAPFWRRTIHAYIHKRMNLYNSWWQQQANKKFNQR